MAILTPTAQPARFGSLRARMHQHPLVAYFVLAFALSWIPILPLTLSRNAGIGMLPYDLPDIVMLLSSLRSLQCLD